MPSEESSSGHWVLKGRPAENDWNSMLRIGTCDEWHTAKPPKSRQPGDRLFCWESSPERRIVGLATLIDPACGFDDKGRTLFRVKYETEMLEHTLGIEELRGISKLVGASFLKSGPATAVHRLSSEQAQILLSLVYKRNPGLPPLPGLPADRLLSR